MVQFLKNLIGKLLFKLGIRRPATSSAQQPASIILNPATNSENFQQELKLRTEEFDRYTMSETIKSLEKSVYHLSANISQLKESAKENKETLVYIATTNEEILHLVEDYLTTPSSSPPSLPQPATQQQSDDSADDFILDSSWDSKKGIAGLN